MVWETETIHPRARVICDNDYGGDPDGLVELAHHLLSPSVDIRGAIGSAVGRWSPVWSETCADDAAAHVRRVAELAGRQDVPVLAGSNLPLEDRSRPMPSPGAEAIVAEALRDDSELPLFVTCGGGLTSIASAWLMEPRIAERLTLAWIGGRSEDGTFEPSPDAPFVEPNTSIDEIAAKVVFNDSDLRVWQVPPEVHGQVVAPRIELVTRMGSQGPLGAHLFEAIGTRVDLFGRYGVHLGETYCLGDSPLVLLTALTSAYEREPSSCAWEAAPRPRLLDSGFLERTEDGPPSRIFTDVDTRLLLEDLYGKLAAHATQHT